MAEAETAEARKSHAEAENQALLKRNRNLRSEFEAETDKLLEVRKAELENLEKEHSKHIEPLKNSISELKDKFEELSSQNLILEADLTALDVEKASKVDDLVNLKDNTESANEKLEDIKTKQTQFQTSIADLSEQKINLESHNVELVEKNNELVQKNRELLDEISSNKEKFETQNTENLRILNNQRAEIRSNTQRMEDESKVQEQIRADLATRIRTVEEREKNVKVREYKVDRDQAQISRNSDLLSL